MAEPTDRTACTGRTVKGTAVPPVDDSPVAKGGAHGRSAAADRRAGALPPVAGRVRGVAVAGVPLIDASPPPHVHQAAVHARAG